MEELRSQRGHGDTISRGTRAESSPVSRDGEATGGATRSWGWDWVLGGGAASSGHPIQSGGWGGEEAPRLPPSSYLLGFYQLLPMTEFRSEEAKEPGKYTSVP